MPRDVAYDDQFPSEDGGGDRDAVSARRLV